MRRRAIALVAGLVCVAMLLPGGTASAAVTVSVGDFFFAPARKTISSGTQVRFNWVGSQRHHIKKKSGPGKGFESKATSARGVNFVKRFNKTGVYRLICTIHPEEMKLKLTVNQPARRAG